MNQQNLVDLIKSWAGENWTQSIASAVVILIITAIVAHLCTKLMRKMLTSESSLLPDNTIFVNIVRFGIWIAGIAVMLGLSFNVDVTALVAALGVVGLAISLGLQGTISNLIGGIQVSALGIVKPGDNIRVGNLVGMVRDVTLRQTVIVDSDGYEIIIPNSTINSTPVEKIWTPQTARVPIYIRPTDEKPFEVLSAEILKRATDAVNAVGPVSEQPRYLHDSIDEYGTKSTLVFEMEQFSDRRPAINAAIEAISDLATLRD